MSEDRVLRAIQNLLPYRHDADALKIIEMLLDEIAPDRRKPKTQESPKDRK